MKVFSFLAKRTQFFPTKSGEARAQYDIDQVAALTLKAKTHAALHAAKGLILSNLPPRHRIARTGLTSAAAMSEGTAP